MIITPDILRGLFTTFHKSFQDGLKIADSEYEKIATVINSTSASSTYGWLGQFPAFQKWTGARVYRAMKAQGYQIFNEKFESTISVPRSDIEDDNIGIYSPPFEQMGRSAKVFPDEQVFPLLRDGENNLCYDGQNFFDTEPPVYPNVDGTGTPVLVSNLFKPDSGPDGAAWYLMDTTQVIKPMIWQPRVKPVLESKTNSQTSDRVFDYDDFAFGGRARGNAGYGLWQLCIKSTKPLNAENFEAARLAMREIKSDGGRPLNIRPNLLVVPPSLLKAANSIVGVATINGGDNPNYKMAEVMESSWINS